MKITPIIVGTFMALSSTSAAFANGQGSPIEPPQPVPVEQPSGPAEGVVQQSARPKQNQSIWWLVAGAVAIAGIVIAVSGDDDDEPSSP